MSIETALALMVLVGGLVVVVLATDERFMFDRLERGARNVAEALAVDPDVDTCPILTRALGPHACQFITIRVWWNLLPSEIKDAFRSDSFRRTGGFSPLDGEGDLFVVRLSWVPWIHYYPGESEGYGSQVFRVLRSWNREGGAVFSYARREPVAR